MECPGKVQLRSVLDDALARIDKIIDDNRVTLWNSEEIALRQLSAEIEAAIEERDLAYRALHQHEQEHHCGGEQPWLAGTCSHFAAR